MLKETKVKGNEPAMNLASSVDEIAFMRMRIIEILNRAGRYVEGYLPEYTILLEKNYNEDPLTLTIKVHLRKSQESNKKEG
jgi:hypothetical protein